MNAEPPTARFQIEHQPRGPGYAIRYATEMNANGSVGGNELFRD
jgi:hypothetical protein